MSGGNQPITHEPQGLIDVTGAAVDSFIKNHNSLSGRFLENQQIKEQYENFKDLEGASLEEAIGSDTFNSDDRWSATDKYIREKRKIDDRYNQIKTTSEMKAAARLKAQQANINLGEVTRAASPFSSVAGNILGGVGAAFTDPITVGAGVAGGLVFRAKTALQLIMIEGAIGAGTELAVQPIITDWQKEIGNEYGLGDALTNVAFAGVASAGLAGITSGALRKGVETTLNKGSVLFEVAANSPKTPEQLRGVLRDMADYIAVREQTPFVNKTVDTDSMHAKNMRAMDEAFNAGKKATDAEIEMNAKLKDIAPTGGARQIDSPTVKPEEEFTPDDLRNQTTLGEDAIERIRQAEQATFERMAQENPDMVVRLDDGVNARLGDISDDIARSSRIYDAIKVCAV